MAQPALRLFWWNEAPNFGDALSRAVVAHLSGREVVWAKPKKADLFAVGSIMRVARKGALSRDPDSPPPVVWGAGAMAPDVEGDFADRARIVAVRGPKTAHHLGLGRDIALGDPGLLAADAFGILRRSGGRIGLVPHWRMIDLPEIAAYLGGSDEVTVVDPRADAETVIAALAGCDVVLSSSLHGLVVADSLGIPNTWIAPQSTHKRPRFKFWDYARAVGRRLGAPVEIDAIAGFLRAPKLPSFDYGDKVAQVKSALVEAFPADLVAAAPVPDSQVASG